MQIFAFEQLSAAVGSHSLPRLEEEPHTWCPPLEVETDLQTLSSGGSASQASTTEAQLM